MTYLKLFTVAQVISSDLTILATFMVLRYKSVNAFLTKYLAVTQKVAHCRDLQEGKKRGKLPFSGKKSIGLSKIEVTEK